MGRHLRTRPTHHRHQHVWRVGLTVLVLVGGGGVLLAGRLGLTQMTGDQAVGLAHKTAGVVVLHAAGVLVVLLGQPAGRRGWAWLSRASALTLAAGAWVTVGLGTWSGYPAYATPPSAGSAVAPRAWLLAHHPGWDRLMTIKVLVGFLAPFVLTAVAVAVIRHPALLAQDTALRGLIRLLLAIGMAAATIAAAIAVGVNTVTPSSGLG